MLKDSSSILTQIYKHPFNQQLQAGHLSAEVFKYYLEQDALYLSDFSSALSITAGRFENRYHTQQFRGLAQYIQSSEYKVHLNYLGKYTRRNQHCSFFTDKALLAEKIPEIARYTEYLLDTATTAPIEIAVASLVPCFWIYRELGKRMQPQALNLNNPYRNWIASYSSRSFIASTASIVQTADDLAAGLINPCQREAMSVACLNSAKFELGFFDAVLSREPEPGNEHQHVKHKVSTVDRQGKITSQILILTPSLRTK